MFVTIITFTNKKNYIPPSTTNTHTYDGGNSTSLQSPSSQSSSHSIPPRSTTISFPMSSYSLKRSCIPISFPTYDKSIHKREKVVSKKRRKERTKDLTNLVSIAQMGIRLKKQLERLIWM